jgi:hypothetical protein
LTPLGRSTTHSRKLLGMRNVSHNADNNPLSIEPWSWLKASLVHATTFIWACDALFLGMISR